MQKNLLTPVIAILLFSCGYNRTVYKAANFNEVAGQNTVIAVLPFNITYTGYRPKNVTEQDIKNSNEKWGYDFQEGLYNQLLYRSSRKRKGPVTSFQALHKTLALLREQNITIEELYKKKPEDVARLLGVDAVIMTTLEQHKNISDGAAYGLAATRAVLAATNKGNIASAFWINSDNINMNCYLYGGSNSSLVWKTFRQGGSSLPGDVGGVVSFFGTWIAKKFPYRS